MSLNERHFVLSDCLAVILKYDGFLVTSKTQQQACMTNMHHSC